MISARPSRGRPGQGSSPPFPDRANLDVAVRHHRPALSKLSDGVGDDLAHQARVVAVDFNRSGMPRLCLFVPFHGGHYGD